MQGGNALFPPLKADDMVAHGVMREPTGISQPLCGHIVMAVDRGRAPMHLYQMGKERSNSVCHLKHFSESKYLSTD
jgi:hypothetical protein